MQEKRLNRINSQIMREVSNIINTEIRDPRLTGLISVSSVKTSNDLSHCKIIFSIYEEDKKKQIQSFNALQHSAGYIRKLLAERVDLRIMPELHFFLDEGYEYSEKMSKLLDSLNIKKEDE